MFPNTVYCTRRNDIIYAIDSPFNLTTAVKNDNNNMFDLNLHKLSTRGKNVNAKYRRHPGSVSIIHNIIIVYIMIYTVMYYVFLPALYIF